MNVFEKLNRIQVELKAPKGNYNSFGKYKYRSCEDILEGLKPLLDKYKVVLLFQDELNVINNEIYLTATVTLLDTEQKQGDNSGISAVAHAREPRIKKGMDEAQITGATSSYARKYALNGLFCIDDTKDSDSMKPPETEGKQPLKQSPQRPRDKGLISEAQRKLLYTKAKDMDKENIQLILGNFNYTSSKEIQRADFNAILAAIEAGV